MPDQIEKKKDSDRIGECFGSYILQQLLGEGGFAEVYLGEHTTLKRPAAIKILRGQITKSALEIFQREAQTLMDLDHTHIVRIRDFGFENDIPFLIMQYAPKKTLRNRHPKGSRLPPHTIVSYLRQIAPALQYIHNKGVIHRDIKPQNILIGANDELLLSDFGIAVIKESTAPLGKQNLTGTIPYMAPEQYRGHPEIASDQYALGVLVYEWLCGERPFKGDTDLQIALQHQSTPPPKLHEKVPNISPAIEQVVLQALAKDPQERFASVQDFAAAFEQACQSSSPARIEKPLTSQYVEPCLDAVAMPQQSAPSPLSNATSTNPTLAPIVTPPPPSPNSLHPQKPTSLAQMKYLFQWKYLLLIILVFALIVGCDRLFLPSFFNTITIANPFAPNGSDNTDTSAMFGFDAAHTHFNHNEHILSSTNVSKLVEGWTAQADTSIWSSPAIANGFVYIGSGGKPGGELYAFDETTGKEKWSHATDGSIFYSSPAVVNRLVYIGSYGSKLQGKLYAFDAATGKQIWVAPTNGAIYSTPAVANGLVYIGSYGISSNSGIFYAFDAITGAQKWFYSSGRTFSSPAVANGVVYVGSISGEVYAFDATTGVQEWASRAGNAIHSSPAVANGLVYIGSDDHQLHAFDVLTGEQKWAATTDGSITSSPMVANGVVYVGSDDHKLYAFDTATGKVLFQSFPSGNTIVSSPAVTNGVVYVGSKDDKLYTFHLPDTTSSSS